MRKSRADKIPCLVFPMVAASLHCTASEPVEGATLSKAGGQDIGCSSCQCFLTAKSLTIHYSL